MNRLIYLIHYQNKFIPNFNKNSDLFKFGNSVNYRLPVIFLESRILKLYVFVNLTCMFVLLFLFVLFFQMVPIQVAGAPTIRAFPKMNPNREQQLKMQGPAVTVFVGRSFTILCFFGMC